MIQRLGKYRIVERIGRGGMGTVYKAHDPMLDRTVALKVISADIDVTDDLRTRFFREAQACARLSHPNVITVYDMGDENGHLYIVMEFLEGDELRQLIAQHRNILLEDKLAMMIEVCDGLDYAHKRGIVHRDIKPGNIYVLKDGHIKLLDFGIARIATAEAGLTRTGLIMGTLRYMSPEQARGRVDHRSDIFSVGAVFYEFLSYQHAFPGNDPMEILERLRSEDPTPLTEIDPSIPAELSDIIARSLRKDPGERYAELAHMRVELERVRLQLTEDANRLRVRVRARFEEIRRLQGVLTERAGQSFEDETVPVVDTRITVATLSSLERMAVTKAERLRQAAEQAEALRPAFEESLAALEAGRIDEAIRGLERIVVDMPDHLRAVEALHRAHERQAAAARARDVFVTLVRQAEAALEQGQPARSLELLRGAGDVPAGAAELGAEVARVREAAERAAERAREEAARKALEQARAKSHEMGVQAAAARERAEGVQAEKYAAAAWAAAAATQQQGTAAQQQHQYEDAARLLREAADEYDRAATAAFEAAEAEARRVEALTREAAGLSEAGRWAEALARLDEGLALMPEHAPATQLRARVEAAQAAAIRTQQRISALLAQAQAALQEGRPVRAQELLQSVGELPAGAVDLSAEVERVRGAVERALVEERAREEAERARQEAERAQAAARQALERARAKADEAAKQVVAARHRAEQAHAATYVAPMMTRAAEQQRQATAAYERQEYDEAARLFAEVAHEYDSAVTAAARERVAALAREAEAALQQGRPARSLELLRSVGDVSAGVPDLAAEVTRVREAAERELAAERARQEAARKALEQARAKSHEMGVQAAAARERADGVQAEKYAAAAWAAAAATQQQGTAAQQQHQYEDASRFFREAADEYDRAATAAFEAAEAEARRVEALTREAAGLSEAGRWAEALARLDEALALMPEHGAATQLRGRVEAAQAAAIRTQQRISAVLAQAEAALQEGQPARGLELLQHVGEVPAGAKDLSAEVDRARSAMEQAVAAERARQEAERKRKEAERVRQEAERARKEAERAQAAARQAQERARARADEAARQVVDARQRAEQADAATYVMPMMTRAAEQQRQATAAYERQEYDEAARLFAESAHEYDGAVIPARTAQARRAETLASEAGALFESGRWVEAEARLDEALALAPEHARATGLRDRVVAARESVAARVHEAEGALEQGQPARSLELLRSVGDVSAGAPELAAQVARVRGAAERAVAAERAREEAARKALEQARAKSQEMGVQAAAARRRAEGVKAEKYASAAWAAAATTQQRGTVAQEQQQYEDAARFFREAAGEYDRAATAAFEAAAAEARRVEALTREAAGLSEAGRWAEALARLDEGLALVPEHAPATQLRARVEAARAAAARTRARQEAERAAREELERAPADEAARRTRAEAAAQREATEQAQRKTPDREAVQRPADVPVPLRRRVPPVAIGLGAAAVVVIGFFVYSQTSSTRPTPAPTPPEATAPAVKAPPSTLASGELEAVEALRKQVTAGRQAAVLAGAELRAAATFASATEKERAADAAVKQRDWPGARSAYNEALAKFDKASAESAALARQEEEAQRAREQMSAARRAAEVGDAARLAQGPWTKATETQRSAEAALKQGELGKAQALFAESAKAYRDADKAASDTKAADAQRAELAARQKLQAAEGAGAAAANARRSAEQSAASRYAPKVFALAQKKEDEGRKSLDRKEYESAESRLREAARDYQAALQEAQRAAETERQRTAEAERQRAAQAERQRVAEAERQKAEAERQKAAEAERQRVAEAERQRAAEAERQRAAEAQRQKAADAERQRVADAERQRVAEAERQKAEAERQVVAARQRQEAEQARRSTADVRAKAHADREQAVKAGADVLAKDVFASAAARESEGDRLAAAQDMVAARQAYQDAAERYGDAGRRARIVQEAKTGADQARARMTAEKERARPDAPEWSAALAQERQATQQYQRSAYREAGESFVAATDLFAKAVARPPDRAPERRPSATDEVRGVLDAYVRAFETKDIALMQKVRPGLKADEVRRLRDSFEQSRDYKVSLKVDSLNVTGDQAVVKGRREDNLISRSGQAFRNESSFTFRLKRTSGGWVIDAVN